MGSQLNQLGVILGITVTLLSASTAFAEDILVTLVGTGNPIPEPGVGGPATLVRIGETSFLFDAGRDVVHGLTRAGVDPGEVDELFLTHMHSDHTTGIPDLLLTGWLTYPGGNRKAPFSIHGPPDIEVLADGLAMAYSRDIEIRFATVPVAPGGEKLAPQIIDSEGVVYDRDGVVITAFDVFHGDAVAPSYGYRVDHEGKSVVISGDTVPSDNLVKHAEGTNLLVHEVFAANPDVAATPAGKAIATIHTSPEQAGEIFTRVHPGMAVFTHIVRLPPAPPSREDILNRARAVYDGAIEMGIDGMTFTVSDEGILVDRP